MKKYEETVNKYRMIYDHHTHTVYSHGKGTIEDNVRVASEKGLSSIAITDHGPGHLTYGIKMEKLPEMRAKIDRLKSVYPDIEVLLGVEARHSESAALSGRRGYGPLRYIACRISFRNIEGRHDTQLYKQSYGSIQRRFVHPDGKKYRYDPERFI